MFLRVTQEWKCPRDKGPDKIWKSEVIINKCEYDYDEPWFSIQMNAGRKSRPQFCQYLHKTPTISIQKKSGLFLSRAADWNKCGTRMQNVKSVQKIKKAMTLFWMLKNNINNIICVCLSVFEWSWWIKSPCVLLCFKPSGQQLSSKLEVISIQTIVGLVNNTAWLKQVADLIDLTS